MADDQTEIEKNERQIVTNALALDVARLKHFLPSFAEVDKVLHYETAIERQL